MCIDFVFASMFRYDVATFYLTYFMHCVRYFAYSCGCYDITCYLSLLFIWSKVLIFELFCRAGVVLVELFWGYIVLRIFAGTVNLGERTLRCVADTLVADTLSLGERIELN